MRVRIDVPEDTPFCAGHFPGHPIVPGVALVEMARRALAASGMPSAVRAIRSLRFRSPVAPGCSLDLAVTAASAGGEIHVEWIRDGAPVASCALRLGGPADFVTLPAADALADVTARGADAASLLPHQPPSRLLDAAAVAREGVVACEARVPPASPFHDGGAVPSFLALEIAAQAAAAFEALTRRDGGDDDGPRRGYLVGSRHAVFSAATLPVDRPLRAVVRVTGVASPLSTYDFEVREGDEVLARGAVSTWLTAIGA